MTKKKRRRHSPEQIVKKLRDGEALLNDGKDLGAVSQALEVSEPTCNRGQNQYGGMKPSATKRLKELEDKNRKLKEVAAERELDNRMLKHLLEGNW